ncbi:MAG: ATP-binding cassette domain-containing protein, partial [Pleurocapsa sp. SU_196_0]|nr:ATP-binding cassette domain-containing protein [Pleurocapsa sp. SU_196_0]
MSDDVLLRSEGVTVQFGGLTAVNNVDFAIPKASIVALIGPNGAGKTTFFNVLTGLYEPTSGSVEFDGKRITAAAPHVIAQRGIARTFQNIRLFGAMTAAANTAFANRQLITHRVREVLGRVFGKDPRALGLSVVYDVCHNIAKLEDHEVDGVRRRCACTARGPH